MTEEIQEIQIKILRLNTGEDIIGACLMDDENGCVGVDNPMKLYMKRVSMAGQAMLVMAPWLPLEVIEENFATINCRNSKTRNGAEVVIRWKNNELFNI